MTKFIIDHKAPAEKVVQALTGLRYIVGPLADPAQWNTEGHNRTCYGLNAAGHLLVLCTEGAYPNQGWTLHACRDYMIEQGAVVAFDAGGGGDVTAWDKSAGLLLRPQNGTETYLPNHLAVFIQEQTNMAKNKVTVTWNDGARERQKPRINSADTYGAVLPDNSVHYSDFDIVPDMDFPNNPDKKWIQLQSGWYIAVRFPPSSGTIYERARVEAIAPPPAPTKQATVSLIDDDGSIYESGVITLTKKG